MKEHPLQAKMRELLQRFTDVHALIEAKRQTIDCQCMMDMLGPQAFLRDSLNELEEFDEKLRAFLSTEKPSRKPR